MQYKMDEVKKLELNDVRITLGTPQGTEIIINDEKMRFVQKITIEQTVDMPLATITLTILASKVNIDGQAIIDYDVKKIVIEKDQDKIK